LQIDHVANHRLDQIANSVDVLLFHGLTWGIVVCLSPASQQGRDSLKASQYRSGLFSKKW
jgi:hypothetical protein